MSHTITKAKNPIKIWTDPDTVEDAAFQQLLNIANLPWIHKHVAVMPDVHYGKGATVGSVIAMKDAISPSAVGVDIGCGMAAVQTSLTTNDLPDDLSGLRSAIEAAIPVGFNLHDTAVDSTTAASVMRGFGDLNAKIQSEESRVAKQLGTLGGGNHFIELCADEQGSIWLMLHSGSRGVGKQIADHHINAAKQLQHNHDLPDPDLAVFLSDTPEINAYRHDLWWAQEYAATNRLTMLWIYKRVLNDFFGHIGYRFEVNCHHNYVSNEQHFGEEVLVTRKGAISAQAGEYGIIPGSMGTGSYIVKGLGNPDSFRSASHGAGRRMSRTKAKKNFTVDDLAQQTQGVECRKDRGVLDEIPGAYKDIDTVIDQQSDLVEVAARLQTLLCVKG